MAVSIENMMKKAIKDPFEFNPYPYEDKAICNQFVFAIEGPSFDSLSSDKALIVQFIPKIYWDKKKLCFTEELNISKFLGENSEDLNSTGNWIVPDLPRDPLECAVELVKRGFIWDKELQDSVIETPWSDVDTWNSTGFVVSPSQDLATKIQKEMNPQIELEIFENRLGIKNGLQEALASFFTVIRTAPITKQKVILEFLKKYNVPYDANIDDKHYGHKARIPTTMCWLDKHEILKYYIADIPKDTVDEYNRTLLDITTSYKAKKSEEILIKNGFVKRNVEVK